LSKITNDGLTRSGTRCFIAVPMCGDHGHEKIRPLGPYTYIPSGEIGLTKFIAL